MVENVAHSRGVGDEGDDPHRATAVDSVNALGATGDGDPLSTACHEGCRAAVTVNVVGSMTVTSTNSVSISLPIPPGYFAVAVQVSIPRQSRGL
jgi:hypothetical protein